MKAQQSKLLVQNGVKRIMCVPTCWSQSSSICVFAFLSGMNALNVKFVKAHWHACSKRNTQTSSIVKRSLQSTVLRVALVVKHCVLTHFLRHQNWRAKNCVKKPGCLSVTTSEWCLSATAYTIYTITSTTTTARTLPQILRQVPPLGLAWYAFALAHVLQGTRNACAVGVCRSSAQCQDDEASEKTDWRHGNCRHPWAKKASPSGLSKRCWEMTQNSKLNLKELISVAFQLRMSKMLKLKQIPRSSSPRICGFKPPTDICPTAERPDNRMKKRLMTKPRRGRAKEHGTIPANDPNVPNTNSWGKQMKGKTQNPETKRAHKINHLMGKNAYKAF